MYRMNRLGVTVLVLILGVVVPNPSTLARKQAKPISSTYNLVPPEVDPPEPRASGQCTFTVHPDLPLLGVVVDVSCRGLTPGKTYEVVALLFDDRDYWAEGVYFEESYLLTTDAKGRLTGGFIAGEGGGSTLLDLWIENEQHYVVLKIEQ